MAVDSDLFLMVAVVTVASSFSELFFIFISSARLLFSSSEADTQGLCFHIFPVKVQEENAKHVCQAKAVNSWPRPDVFQRGNCSKQIILNMNTKHSHLNFPAFQEYRSGSLV